MEPRICCLFVLALQIVSLVSATSRPLAANDDVGANHPGPQSSPASLGSKQGTEGKGGIDEEAYLGGLGRIGSSPPSCELKCYGCTPCQAIQVPTTGKRAQTRLGVNYANYEPIGWKCKCGPSIYSP